MTIGPLYDLEDLSVFFEDFGQSLVWDGVTYACLFDRKHDPLAFGASGRAITAIGKTAELGEISQGEVITVAGESFTVAEVQPIQDGQLVRLVLEES